MKCIALFDFDETLVLQNSLGLLFRHFLNNRPLVSYLLPVVWDKRVYLGDAKSAVKDILYRKALSGQSKSALEIAGKAAASDLTEISSTVAAMNRLNESGVEVWIITASPQLYVQAIVERLNWPVTKVLGTLLNERDGILDGSYQCECQLQEKVRRFNHEVTLLDEPFNIVEAYGNPPVDNPMIDLAQRRFYVVKGELT